jgi:hypothetical protein
MIERFGLIIGAMKGGTTTLFDHLARHPEIAASRSKEPGFFAFDDVNAKGREWYEALFSFNPAVHKIALEASTDYSKFPHCGDVPARLAAFGGDYRLIYSLRNPLRRIESHALHVAHRGREIGRIDVATGAEGLDGGVSPASLDMSRYAMQLDQYRDYFNAGALMITSVERLQNDPAGVVRAACLHFGVDPNLAPKEIERRNDAGQTWRARELHPLWRAAASVAPLRVVAKSFVPDAIRKKMRLKTRPATRVQGRFKLRPDEEAAIIETLAPDLRRLRDEYGFNVAREWGIDL